jgi:hypothetical protein
MFYCMEGRRLLDELAYRYTRFERAVWLPPSANEWPMLRPIAVGLSATIQHAG